MLARLWHIESTLRIRTIVLHAKLVQIELLRTGLALAAICMCV